MKVVILCGGLGTRLSEETDDRPKPMVEIGGIPMLWHIMRIYAQQGFRDFVLALGYKGEVIKDFVRNYRARTGDYRIDLATGEMEFTGEVGVDWNVELVDTGAYTMTGGRIARLRDRLSDPEGFMVTYGDGVGDVDLHALLEQHRREGTVATVTAVRPPARFGGLTIEQDRVTRFREKSQIDAGWINGGFFVFRPEIFDYLDGDEAVLEEAPLESLAAKGELSAYTHPGFWQCMDTVRDKRILEDLWAGGQAFWATEEFKRSGD
jgi:glucose-1-phosphate cytidylyltransferase